MASIELPICRWRREETAPGRHACVSPKLITGQNGVPDTQCVHCYCRDHPAKERPRGPCAHLGPRTGLEACPPCSNKAGRAVSIPVHQCGLHGSCSIGVHLGGMPCCLNCPDHLPQWRQPVAGDVRHLIYHCYPADQVWRWNIAQLRQRMSLFNGERIISVATSPETASFDEVCAELDGLDCTIWHYDNDPVMREMATFPDMLAEMSRYQGAADVTFYGHAKGVTSERWGPAVRQWTESMYVSLLDHWPAVRRALVDYPVVGILQRLRSMLPGSTVRWHYSGSFRWTRNRDLYARDWRQIDQNWCGGEGHSGKHFAASEAACLWGSFGAGGLGLYLTQTWDQWARQAYDTWLAEAAADRWQPMLATVILTAHAQPERVHEAIRSVIEQTTADWQLLIMDSGRIAPTGAYDRYASDARIEVVLTGESPELRRQVGIQAWSINEAWRRGLVRGDLVAHLCDDDVYHADALAVFLNAARGNPDQRAWYRAANRCMIDAGGGERPLGMLVTRGVGQFGNRLDCRVDGMQVAHRRTARTEWPQEPSTAWHADGIWMDTLAGLHPIHPLPGVCGVHRHTPESTFTKGV